MSLKTFMFKSDAHSLSKVSHYVTLSKFVDTPVNGRPSVFGIDSETSLSHALFVYTKSMV
jgi:hypothetical protein